MLLKFKTADLKILVEHAQKSEKFRMPFSRKKGKPALLLVKDQGVYFMSNGLPHLPNPNNPKHSLVVYAEGYTPEVGHIGGDDWCETFEIDDTFQQMLTRQRIEITVTRNVLDIKAYN